MVGIIPTILFSGDINPGQFGPIRLAPFLLIKLCASTTSSVGIPSVIQIINSTPASAASIIASLANVAGTNITDVFASVSLTASFTVLKTGTPSTNSPAFPGETPPTTLVPYDFILDE